VKRIDATLIAVLLFLGAARVWVTPEFAADLPQDAADFVNPALNLLERGKLISVVSNNTGAEIAMGHPIGLPLLLAPVYWLTGHFPGNGIYLIQLLYLATLILVYVAGTRLAGRVGGAVAAVFLIANHGAALYATKIMSEGPATFALMALYVLAAREKGFLSSAGIALAAGAVAGLAIVIRYDNVLFFAPLVVIAFLQRESFRWRGVALFVVGALPFLAGQAAYNARYYGSATRVGYQYAGNAGTEACPMFTWRNALTESYLAMRPELNVAFTNLAEGNLILYAKTVVSEADSTLPFSGDPRWRDKPKALYQKFVLARFALALTGFVLCFVAPGAGRHRVFLRVWLSVLVPVMIGFYAFYFWQEERFFLRLVPWQCLLTGVTVAEVVRWLRARPPVPRWAGTASVAAAAIGLAGAFWAFTVTRSVIATAGNPFVYEAMTCADEMIEPDAIVVTNFDPVRTYTYLSRLKPRLVLQLGDEDDYGYVPVPGQIQYMNGDSVLKEPRHLVDLLRHRRPAYFLNKYVGISVPPPELVELSKAFELEAVTNSCRNLRVPFLYRITGDTVLLID